MKEDPHQFGMPRRGFDQRALAALTFGAGPGLEQLHQQMFAT
jgi:hypothetical protein